MNQLDQFHQLCGGVVSSIPWPLGLVDFFTLYARVAPLPSFLWAGHLGCDGLHLASAKRPRPDGPAGPSAPHRRFARIAGIRIVGRGRLLGHTPTRPIAILK